MIAVDRPRVRPFLGSSVVIRFLRTVLRDPCDTKRAHQRPRVHVASPQRDVEQRA